MKWSLYGPDVLAAWVAEMDFDVAPPVRDALLAAVAREDFGYVPADLTELTTACAAFLDATTGWQVPPSRVFPVADVLTGIAAAIDLYSPPGTAVVVPTPAYPPFFDVVALTGRPVDEAPMVLERGRWCLDVERIDRHLAAGARTVLLCSPHNPTGTVHPPETLAALAELAKAFDATVISDEIHAPLTYPGATFTPFLAASPVAAEIGFAVTSASKAFNLAGLKCALMITAGERPDEVVRSMPIEVEWRTGQFGMLAGTAAFSADSDPWLDGVLVTLDRHRRLLAELLAEELPGARYRIPDAGYLAWIDLSALGWGDDPARRILREARVALHFGPHFGDEGRGFVRLNFACAEEVLVDAVRRIGALARS